MNKKYLFSALLLFAGCATAPVTIEVPIPTPCDPPAVAAPAKPIDALGPASDLFEVTRALWATVEILDGYAEQLRAAADACRAH